MGTDDETFRQAGDGSADGRRDGPADPVRDLLLGLAAQIDHLAALFAPAGGTKMTDALAPVSLTASATVLNTGRSRCCVPPLPGVTPPTTCVPYSIICVAWKLPCEPVKPCTITLVFLLIRTDMLVPGRFVGLRQRRRRPPGRRRCVTRADPDAGALFYMMYLYKNAFGFAELGYASALAVLLFLVGLALALLIFWLSRRFVNYDVEAG